MNIPGLDSNPSVRAAMLAAQAGNSGQPTAAQLDADRKALSESTSSKSNASQSKLPSAADIKKAASQFEAIIVRQLLEPTIATTMKGMGGESSSGGGIYGYMVTDVLASNLTSGGGLGLASLLEKQFSQGHSRADK